MTQHTLHRLLHEPIASGTQTEAETQPEGGAEPSPRDLSRKELFLELQQASEESRTARRKAVDQAHTADPV